VSFFGREAAKDGRYMRKHVLKFNFRRQARVAGDRNPTMSCTNLLVHLVFGTKGRLPLINSEIRERLHAYMGGTLRGLGAVALEIGGVADHVHLLIVLRPTIRLSDLIRDLKSNSSSWMKDNGVRKFGWQRRYGAFSVSESQKGIVRRYIRNQEAHHRKFDFQTEFETMLRKTAFRSMSSFGKTRYGNFKLSGYERSSVAALRLQWGVRALHAHACSYHLTPLRGF
jgi:REP element-mobilizing transposase RayT